MEMERTQLYIPSNLKQRLHRFAAVKKINASEAMREALEEYLCEWERTLLRSDEEFLQVLDRAFGMWKDRDPKEFEETHRSLDRKFDAWND